MFKRKSKSPEKVGIGSTLGSLGPQHQQLQQQQQEYEDKSGLNEDKSGYEDNAGSPTNQPINGERAKEILKDIFKLPADPRFEIQSQLLTDPQGVLLEYLPCILKFMEWTTFFMIGLFGLSYAWVLTGFLLYCSRGYLRDSGLAGLDPTKFRHEKEILKAQSGAGRLPSWVVFPDVERVEWINTIMKKVWPNLGEITRQIAKRLVEPKIQEILNRLRLQELSNFRLKDVLLGSVPARLGGIKVYDRNTGRDEIVMDVEIIYQGDARVNFAVQNMQCEINQVSFRGVARVTIKPILDTMPLVGGLELYFMQMPDFDYSLGKLATVAEIPGVSNLIKSVLDNIIRRGLVWPNRFSFFFPIESVQNLRNQTFAMPAPQGVLMVEVVRGRHLVKKDKHLLGGKSDPYIVLAIGEKKISFKNRYAESTVEPEWGYSAEFAVEEVSGLDLNIEVYDYDAGSEDDFMGRTALSVQGLVEKSIKNSWIRLDDTKHGEIEVSAYWKPVLPAQEIKEKIDIYVVSVFVDSCRHLASGKSTPPFSKCELSVSSPSSSNLAPTPLNRRDSKKWVPSTRYEAYTTIPRGPSENPVFREGHFFLCKNPHLDSIAVQVVDHRSGLLLGSTWVELKHLLSLPDKQFSRMEMPLENNQNSDSVIVLSAKVYAAVN